MFFRKTKHIDILVSRHGASVYLDGRYIHVDVKLSIKSSRDRNALRDVVSAINEAIELEENPITLAEDTLPPHCDRPGMDP